MAMLIGRLKSILYYWTKEPLLYKFVNFANSSKVDRATHEILADFDYEGFNRVSDACKENYDYYCKYLKPDVHIKTRLYYYFYLKLQDMKGLDVLDLGTGCGWFPYICRFYGNNVQTIDIDNYQVFNKIIEFFGLPRIVHKIAPSQALPEFPNRFDLITAFQTYFQFYDNSDEEKNTKTAAPRDGWDVDEWEYFLKDIKNNHLKDDGQLFMVLNRYVGFDEKQSRIMSYLRGKGAEVFKSQEGIVVHFHKL